MSLCTSRRRAKVNAHVILGRVVARGAISRLTCAKSASRERAQRAHAEGHRQSTARTSPLTILLFPLYDPYP